MRRHVLHICLGAILLRSQLALAQSLTGALIVTVKDEHGAVIAGATVRLTSPALIGHLVTPRQA